MGVIALRGDGFQRPRSHPTGAIHLLVHRVTHARRSRLCRGTWSPAPHHRFAGGNGAADSPPGAAGAPRRPADGHRRPRNLRLLDRGAGGTECLTAGAPVTPSTPV